MLEHYTSYMLLNNSILARRNNRKLVEWTRTAFSSMDTTPSFNPIDYVHHILYATVGTQRK